MKKGLINVTKNVLDPEVSKKVGKKLVLTTIITDGLIVGLYAWYLRWSKKKDEELYKEINESL
jgi:hypothetical protein